jgi:hypothetical protein
MNMEQAVEAALAALMVGAAADVRRMPDEELSTHGCETCEVAGDCPLLPLVEAEQVRRAESVAHADDVAARAEHGVVVLLTAGGGWTGAPL